jgi:hypothetical protein
MRPERPASFGAAVSGRRLRAEASVRASPAEASPRDAFQSGGAKTAFPIMVGRISNREGFKCH